MVAVLMMATESDAKMTSRWRLGWVLPCLMLVVMAMDFALHLEPLDVFVNCPHEALGQLHTPEGPFEPNREFHNARSYGDLAALGNLPRRRVYRRVDFATDAFGFHNPAAEGLAPAGILFGDSFAIGAEVPEQKSLSAQLTALFSGPIYNAGGFVPLDFERVRQLASRLKLRTGAFIYEFHEAHLKELPPPAAPGVPSWRHKLAVRVLGPRGVDRLKGWLSSLPDSRLELLARKFERALENDAVLPNSFASSTVEGRLRNGDWMLFLPSRIAPVNSPDAAVVRWADFFRRLSGELGRDGLELVVVIVPEKFTVYAPLLAWPRPPAEGDVLLGQLERRLREACVPVVNVTPAFRAAAAELAERHQYIYWQDDTHWNECGVTIAVAEFRAQIGSQTLPAFVGGALPRAHPSAAGTAQRPTLPPNCQSQQEYAAASLSAP